MRETNNHETKNMVGFLDVPVYAALRALRRSDLEAGTLSRRSSSKRDTSWHSRFRDSASCGPSTSAHSRTSSSRLSTQAPSPCLACSRSLFPVPRSVQQPRRESNSCPPSSSSAEPGYWVRPDEPLRPSDNVLQRSWCRSRVPKRKGQNLEWTLDTAVNTDTSHWPQLWFFN